jgi:PKD repeat protein
MKKLNLVILFIAVHIRLLAIDVTVSDPKILKYNGWNKTNNPSEWIRQFIIPIEMDGVNLNKVVEFTVTGVNSNVGLKIRDFETGNIFTSYTFNGTSGTFLFDATNALSTLYIFEFYYISNGNVISLTYTGTTIPVNFYFVTERCKKGTFTSTNYQYKLNWVDYWLKLNPSPNNYLLNTENALKFSWDKQITGWDLCNGLPGNVPLDNDFEEPTVNINQLDLNVNGYDQKKFPYRGCVASNAMGTSAGRNINIDYFLYQMSPYLNYATEYIALTSTIGHEFFHNVQYSHNQTIFNDYAGMKWLIEGQAVLMQTLLMEEMSSPNEEYLNNRYYYGRTEDMLEQILNKQFYPNGDGIYFQNNPLGDIYPYGWSVLWRYLFDTYTQNNGTLPNTQTGLDIVKESLINATSVSNIQTNMDNVLATGGGNYNTLNNLLSNFAEDFYFCNNLDISNFINVNSSNFYSGIRTGIASQIYQAKNQIVTGNSTGLFYNEYAFDGSNLSERVYSSFDPPPYYTPTQLQSFPINLTYLYQIQSREVFLNNVGADLELTINNDINGDGNNTHVRAYIVDANDQILSAENVDLNGQSSQTFNMPVVNATDKLVLLFIRTDANANLTGDLTVDFAPLGNTTCAEFKADNTNPGQGETVNFTNLSCTNATSWQWDFPGGNPAQSTNKNPQVTYQTQGNYSVTLTAINNNGQVVETKQDYIKVKRVMANDIEFDFTYKFMKAIPGTGTQYQFVGQVPQADLGDVQSWEWKVGSGAPQNGPNSSVTHTFPISEIISEVTLTVHFNDGTSKSKTQKVYHLGI